jgi:hypothetical protein
VSASSGIQWYLDGLPILGASTPSIPINAEGTYTVVVDSGGECGEVQSAPYTVVFQGVSGIDKSISLYPNPSKGKFFIDANAGIEQVQVYGMDGRLVADIQTGNVHRVQLDLTSNASGLYTSKIRFSDGTISTKRLQIK